MSQTPNDTLDFIIADDPVLSLINQQGKLSFQIIQMQAEQTS